MSKPTVGCSANGRRRRRRRRRILTSDTIDSVQRHLEVVRAKDLSALLFTYTTPSSTINIADFQENLKRLKDVIRRKKERTRIVGHMIFFGTTMFDFSALWPL